MLSFDNYQIMGKQTIREMSFFILNLLLTRDATINLNWWNMFLVEIMYNVIIKAKNLSES